MESTRTTPATTPAAPLATTASATTTATASPVNLVNRFFQLTNQVNPEKEAAAKRLIVLMNNCLNDFLIDKSLNVNLTENHFMQLSWAMHELLNILSCYHNELTYLINSQLDPNKIIAQYDEHCVFSNERCQQFIDLIRIIIDNRRLNLEPSLISPETQQTLINTLKTFNQTFNIAVWENEFHAINKQRQERKQEQLQERRQEQGQERRQEQGQRQRQQQRYPSVQPVKKQNIRRKGQQFNEMH